MKLEIGRSLHPEVETFLVLVELQTNLLLHKEIKKWKVLLAHSTGKGEKIASELESLGNFYCL